MIVLKFCATILKFSEDNILKVRKTVMSAARPTPKERIALLRPTVPTGVMPGVTFSEHREHPHAPFQSAC